MVFGVIDHTSLGIVAVSTAVALSSLYSLVHLPCRSRVDCPDNAPRYGNFGPTIHRSSVMWGAVYLLRPFSKNYGFLTLRYTDSSYWIWRGHLRIYPAWTFKAIFPGFLRSRKKNTAKTMIWNATTKNPFREIVQFQSVASPQQ
jgi:hypothetical protein